MTLTISHCLNVEKKQKHNDTHCCYYQNKEKTKLFFHVVISFHAEEPLDLFESMHPDW